MKTSIQYYHVDRTRISFVKFILEAYDNTAVLSTLDSEKGLVQLTIAPGCESLVTGVMQSLGAQFPVACVAPDGLAGDDGGPPPAW